MLHKIATTILAVAVIILSYTNIKNSNNQTHAVQSTLKYFEVQSGFNDTQLITNKAILEHINYIRAELKVTDMINNEQEDIIKAMSKYDFSTTKALCDRIAKLEAATNNQKSN